MSVARFFGNASKSGGIISNILDGKLGWDAWKLANGAAQLIGEDKFGNKYYQDNTQQNGRHRWVSYADKFEYNASSVPPEWHSWLHSISDKEADEMKTFSPAYEVPHYIATTGTPECYVPKGHYRNPQKFGRSWVKTEAWVPK